MWMIEVVTFLALSPSPYMITPHPTAQYGHVLRVSVVRASLKLRVSARTAVGENPSMARLEPARPAALTLKNCLRFMSIDGPLHSFESPRSKPDFRPGRYVGTGLNWNLFWLVSS